MSLYENVVDLSRPYLGIATEQFLERQCRAHLNCDPHELTNENIIELAQWIEIAGGLVIDKARASELKQKVLKLISV